MPSLAPFSTRYAPRGMVCAVDHLAAEAGIAMLRSGGSAADAAIAASAVLAVTTQHMCGMGGDLFALVHEPGRQAPTCLNASGRAGSGADPGALRDEGHAVMPFRGDIRSVPVPGCVDGWLTLHERHGRLDLREVLSLAIGYAANGFPASPTLARSVALIHQLPDAADYLAHGRLRPGDTVRRPGVARSLEAIIERGREGFYGGEFGEGLLALGGGEFTPADLDRTQADWVDPISVDAFGRTIWTVPPNSQGYLTLAGAWIADRLELPEDPDDPSWAHLTIEAARQAAHDRLGFLSETADAAAFLAADHLDARRKAIDPAHAAALGDRYRAGGTMYLCAVDDERMGVSLIQSNAAGWGSHLIEPSTRIFLQNRGVGFSLEADHPAEYGPGRRPPHTLSPALTTNGTALDMVIGTMGGDTQPQILVQLLARLTRSGHSPADAVSAGRWGLASPTPGTGFDTWASGGDVVVRLEGHAPSTWDPALAERGHRVERAGAFEHEFGHAHVIRVDDDHLAGASDPRALGGAAATW